MTETVTQDDVAAMLADPIVAEMRKGNLGLDQTSQGVLAAGAVAGIEARKGPVPLMRGGKLSEDGHLDHWMLRPGLISVIGYWTAKYPVLHAGASRCLKGFDGETRTVQWAQEEYDRQVAGELSGRERTTWFCTRCVVTYRATAGAVAAGTAPSALRPTVEDGVNRVLESEKPEASELARHGQPCPACHTELPLAGPCGVCCDEAPATVIEPALLDQVKAYAAEPAHYEAGWDVFLEAYTDEEILAILGRTATFKGAIKKLKACVGA